MDLFVPIIPKDKMHPQFVELLRSPLHNGARQLISELAARMSDPNGAFIRHFQGAAFHSRLFEIACFAYLEEVGLLVDRKHHRPDFMASRGDATVAVEAVTANPSGSQAADISLGAMTQLSRTELFQKVNEEVPRRISNSLVKKLRHCYHQLDHCKEFPLVLMIAPVFEAGAPFYTDDALLYPLFGGPEGAPRSATPFFQRNDSSSVSAVLYCNQFTVSKFLRLATESFPRSDVSITRHGVGYYNSGPDELALRDFSYTTGAPGSAPETWANGITVFENPFADRPLSRGMLPASCYVFVEDGYVQRDVRDFHPVVSFTHICPATT